MTQDGLETAIGLAEEAATRAQEAADRAEEAAAGKRHTRNEEPSEETRLSVSINSPHTASVIGKSVALRINSDGAAGGGGSGDTTVAQNVPGGEGSVEILMLNTNVTARSLKEHADGSIQLSEDLGIITIQAVAPGPGNSYPVAINECPSIGGTDTEVTPAVERLKFIGRLFTVDEPTPDVVTVTANLEVVGGSTVSDVDQISFVGATVAEDAPGLAKVTITPDPVAVNEVPSIGGTDTELTPDVERLKFIGRLFTVAEPTPNVVTVTANLQVVGGSTVSDVDQISFVGATVEEDAPGLAKVTITPSGGSALTIKDEGTDKTTAATSIDIIGATITAAATGGAATITMQELVFRWNVNGASTDVIVAAFY